MTSVIGVDHRLEVDLAAATAVAGPLEPAAHVNLGRLRELALHERKVTRRSDVWVAVDHQSGDTRPIGDILLHLERQRAGCGAIHASGEVTVDVDVPTSGAVLPVRHGNVDDVTGGLCRRSTPA